MLFIDGEGIAFAKMTIQNISTMGSPRHKPEARALCQATRR
jgi:hypothetical protein